MTENQWTNMIGKSFKGQKGNIIDTEKKIRNWKGGKRRQTEKS